MHAPERSPIVGDADRVRRTLFGRPTRAGKEHDTALAVSEVEYLRPNLGTG